MSKLSHGWKRETCVLALLLTFVMVVALAFAFDGIMQARAVAKESAKRALLVESRKLLSDYFAIHGHFPKTLDELPFTYPDGGDKALLDEFQYTLQGDECRIVVRYAFTGELVTESISAPTLRASGNTP